MTSKLSSTTKPIARFKSGQKYDRRTDINGPFGGSARSGIAPSNVVDAIFLFTGDSGQQYGYTDKYELDGHGALVFSYTGEGQVGHMQFTRGNRAISEHSKTGRALHLFRSLGKGKGQQYLGEFVYAGHRLAQGPDKKGNQRELIIFQLVGVEQAEMMETAEQAESVTPEMATVPSLDEARLLAIAAASAGTAGSIGQSAVRTLYKRSTAVKRYVLMRANGICESCTKPAPFVRADGTPYLEPHHTTRVSDGGPDHPRYVAAICPACHREIHHGKAGEAKNAALQDFLENAEGIHSGKKPKKTVASMVEVFN